MFIIRNAYIKDVRQQLAQLKHRKDMQTKTAIDFIKESSFYVNERYQWLRELIDLILNNKSTDNYILKLVNRLSKSDNEKNNDDSEKVNKIQIENEFDEKFINIKKINSLNKLSNIGLLEINKPILFNNGLTVFYGKNGAGKSSFFLGLCNTLGYKRNVFPNINNEQNNSSCEITITDGYDKKQIIAWETGIECSKTNVQIFDNRISNFIVENEQLNQFELAYLKTEYFVILHSHFEKLSELFQNKLTEIERTNELYEKLITDNAPIFWEHEKGYTEATINAIEFSEENKIELEELEKEIDTINNSDLEAVIKNINTANDQVKIVLNSLGKLEKVKNDHIKEKKQWSFVYNTSFFDEINRKIELYNKETDAYDKTGTTKLSSLIPSHWINDESWKLFIDKSIEFINKLEKDERQKYAEESCPYCQQPLQTAEAKELIKIYHTIREEHKEKLDLLKNKLSEFLLKFKEIRNKLKSVNNKVIEEEFEHVGLSEPMEIFKLDEVFDEVQTALTTYVQIENAKLISDKLKKYWNLYLPIHEKFLTKSSELNKSLSNKNGILIELKQKAKPLQNRKSLFENKETLEKYLKNKELIKNIKEKLADLTEIKKATSHLETQFSKEVPLKIFKEYLEKEYEQLNFTPHETWNIAASTHQGENRRFYNLRDKSISDIFSEGERKIHALADFFAQLELNNFKGVFIFDDPVNSLDEERIEYVTNRIIKLADEGNQVIVFTHNLIFLNSLVDTSSEKVNLINKLSSQIIIETGLKLGTEAELKKLIVEVQRRMEKIETNGENNADILELRNIYDLMSGYIESYVEIKIFKNIINRYRPNIRMNSLEKMKDFEDEKLTDLIDLYKQTSRKGSRHSQPVGTQPPKYLELKEHFKILKTNFNFN